MHIMLQIEKVKKMKGCTKIICIFRENLNIFDALGRVIRTVKDLTQVEGDSKSKGNSYWAVIWI